MLSVSNLCQRQRVIKAREHFEAPRISWNWECPVDMLTCGDDTIHIPGLEFLVEKVWPGGLQLFVIAGHDCDVVDPVRG